jgi:hypothetical protein
LVLKFEDQDQPQDKNEVQVLVMIEDHLVERKGLRQVERKGLKEGFKVTHQIKSITWINQTMSFQVSIKNGSLERGHFSLW